MSRVLISRHLDELATRRQISGAHRESMVREAFKDLPRGRVRSRDEGRRDERQQGAAAGSGCGHGCSHGRAPISRPRPRPPSWLQNRWLIAAIIAPKKNNMNSAISTRPMMISTPWMTKYTRSLSSA